LLAAIEYLVEVSGIRKIVVETNGVADPANVPNVQPSLLSNFGSTTI
jgi:hypothetical protein